MGNLIGISLRTKQLMSVELSSFFWKTIVGDKITIEDLEAVDASFVNTLKQVRAERVRFQKDMAKKAREAQLEQRKRELEEKRQRQRDHKEQEALEKQIRQLEVRLSHERGGREARS